MTIQLIPPIGTSGKFQLLAPYAAQLITNAIYTCEAIRRLSDIINAGLDPYERYYQPYNITRDTYNSHVAGDICILSLQASSGEWLFVPSEYVSAYPNMNGVAYTSLVMGLNLGPIPDHLDLGPLKQRLIDDVKDFVGITATATTVAVSATQLLAQSVSTAIEASRVAQITNSNTDRSKLLAAQAQVTALTAKVAELENYIKLHIPP